MAKISKKTQNIINSVESIQDYVGKELHSTEEVEQAIEEIVEKEAAKVAAPKKSTKVRQLVALQNPSTEVSPEKAEEIALAQQLQEAKAALKQSRGKTISPAIASEIAAAKGLDTTGKKAKVVAPKKLSLAEAQLAASGKLPQQQDIMGDVRKPKAAKPKQEKAPAIQFTREQVLAMIADRRGGMKITEILKKYAPDQYNDAGYNEVRAILNGDSHTELSGLTGRVQPDTNKKTK
jgi:hypothetical protein